MSESMGLGIIIVSICVGSIYEAVHGWLTFGMGCILFGLVEAIAKSVRRRKA